jgi:hypothetical protein
MPLIVRHRIEEHALGFANDLHTLVQEAARPTSEGKARTLRFTGCDDSRHPFRGSDLLEFERVAKSFE